MLVFGSVDKFTRVSLCECWLTSLLALIFVSIVIVTGLIAPVFVSVGKFAYTIFRR